LKLQLFGRTDENGVVRAPIGSFSHLPKWEKDLLCDRMTRPALPTCER
jgi:hypothetical protein